MPSQYQALNDASRLAHAALTGTSPNPEHWRERERERERLDGILRLLNRDDRAFVRELIERRTGLP